MCQCTASVGYATTTGNTTPALQLLQTCGRCACHFMTTHPPTHGLPTLVVALEMDDSYSISLWCLYATS